MSMHEEHDLAIPDPTILQHEHPQAYADFLLRLTTVMQATQTVSRPRLQYLGHALKRRHDHMYTDYSVKVAFGYLMGEPDDTVPFPEYADSLTFFLRQEHDSDPQCDVTDTVTVQLGDDVILLQPEFERLKRFVPSVPLFEVVMLSKDVAYALSQKFGAYMFDTHMTLHDTVCRRL